MLWWPLDRSWAELPTSTVKPEPEGAVAAYTPEVGRTTPKHMQHKLTLTRLQWRYFGLQDYIIKAALLLEAPASALQVAG